MSHKTIVFSPEGTPLADCSVGEIVAGRPTLARVFQSHKIDFCCQGGKTLREACQQKGVSLAGVEQELEAEMKGVEEVGENPAMLPPAELADYIVAKHHDYLRRELPRVYAMSERVAKVHGAHTPSLVEVFKVVSEMSEELTSHIIKEENVLFPAVKAMSEGGHGGVMPLSAPIACMLEEHDDAGSALERLRELTNGYTPPADACNTYRALFAGLEELETDLHRHIHLENAVLFPQALALSEAFC